MYVVGIPLVIYLRYAIKLAYMSREYALGDAVCYIRRAMYLARGDLANSVSGYWSPLISWSIAPFVYFGMDGVYAARVVLCVWGAVLVVAFGWLLYQIGWLNDWWRLGILAAVAMGTAEGAGNYITPDVIVAACLFAYFAVMVHPELMRKRRLQLAAGLLGGLAYLAKAYAFPFVLLHLPMTLVIRRRWEGWKRGEAMGAWGMAMVGWAAVAGTWVGVLSWRYGGLTFGTSGALAHAYVGPAPGRALPDFGPPADPFIVAWENPETIAHWRWSPFSSWGNFERQIRVIRENGQRVWRMLWGMDRLHLAWWGVVVSPVMLWIGRRSGRWVGVWMLLTVVLYVSGYLVVYFTERYIWFVMWPMGVLLCMGLVLGMRLEGAWKAGQYLAAAGLLVGFVIGAKEVIEEREREAVSPMVYRRVAAGVKKAGIRGPFAGNHALKSYPVALYLEEKFLLFPAGEDVEVIEKRVREATTGMILLWGGGQPAYERENVARKVGRLVERGGWKRAEIRGIGGVEVYVPVEGRE